MPKQDSEQTPEGRITRKFLAILRRVQGKYPFADVLQGLVHASYIDLEEGVRAQVTREIRQAQHDQTVRLLGMPYGAWEGERRRIAALLAQPDEATFL